MRLVTIYHQINGPYHNNSKKESVLMEQCKKQYVLMLKGGCAMMYQVWQYSNNPEKGIKLGPITEPRHVENKTASSLINAIVLPCKG